MNFARPELLWLLLAAALLLWISARPQRRRLTTHMLLQRAMQATVAQSSWRLRWNNLLLGAGLLAALLALAGLQIAGPDAPLVVLVDARASLQTRSADTTAEQRGLALVAQRWGHTQRVLQVADVAAAAAQQLAAGARVVAISDRERLQVPMGAGVVQVGDDEPNAGITALGVDAESRLLVSAARRTTALGAVPVRTLHVVVRAASGAERVVCSEPLNEAPLTRVLALEALLADDTVIARLTPRDAFSEDDAAQLVAMALPLRIGLPSEGAVALQRALAAQENTEILRGPGPCDLRVGDGDGRHRLQVVAADAGVAHEGILGGVASRACAGEKMHLALASAPAGAATLVAFAGAPLLVRHQDVFVLLTDPAAMDGSAALPLLCADLLAQLRPQQHWRATGVLDADATSGARAQHDRVLTEPAPSSAFASCEHALLAASAALLLVWLILQFRARRRS